MSITPLPPQSYTRPSPGPALAPEKKPAAAPGDRPTQHESPAGAATRKGASTTGIHAESEPPLAPGALEKLRKLAPLLSQLNIVSMFRDPYSTQTAQNRNALHSLLSDESINSLSKDPAVIKKVRAAIGEVLSDKNIRHLQRQAAAVHVPELTPERIRQRTSDPDPNASYAANLQIEEELKKEDVNIEQRTRQCAPLCKTLIDIGTKVRQDEHETPTTRPQAPSPSPSPSPSPAKTSPEILERMRKIVDILSAENLIRMLSEPNSEWTQRRVSQMKELLSEASLKSLTKNPKELAQVETAIENVLSDTNIESLKTKAKNKTKT